MKKELSADGEGKDEERPWGKIRLRLQNNKYRDSIRKKERYLTALSMNPKSNKMPISVLT